MSLNRAIKKLFFTTSKLNIALHLTYITSKENEGDAPSRRLTTLDRKLHPKLLPVPRLRGRLGQVRCRKASWGCFGGRSFQNGGRKHERSAS